MDMKEGKYLTFSLGKEEYGIPILKVKEIIGMMEITPIPKTPIFVQGVINLRGKIIPIIDLRLKFSLEKKEYTERTCIIVVDIESGETKRQVGVAVDAVSEVVNIQKDAIEEPPEYDEEGSEEFLTGIGKLENKVVMLLNTDKVLNFKGITNMDLLNNQDRGDSNVKKYKSK
ncbi:MAG: chemotaxis protein CheW [Halanaerobiales bacterium]